MRIVFETKRLSLKILDKSYSQSVLDYYTRNKVFLEKWEAIRTPDFYTKKFQKNQLKVESQDIRNGTLIKLWIFKKNQCDKMIGCISFNNIIRGPFLSCFLSYKLDHEEVNKGYMTEALEAAIKIIFNDYGLHRIEANIIPGNYASLRVLEKCGFLNEGLSKKYLRINGVWHDHIHMVLLNEEME